MYEQLATILVVAIVLGMDAFSLSMGMGLQGVLRKYAVKFASIVAFMHVVMPLIGLSLGLAVGKILGMWAARIGALILAWIGIDFIRKGYRELKPKSYSFADGREAITPTNFAANDDWWTLILLGVSVSMDALTVGFSLGTIRVPITITVGIMGLIAGTMTLLGFISGRIFSSLVGSYAQVIGGIILLALAVKLVL